jgi:hypothetical protein
MYKNISGSVVYEALERLIWAPKLLLWLVKRLNL